MLTLFRSKPTLSKQLGIITKKVKDITEDSRTINESLVSINGTNSLLVKVLDKFEAADFTAQKERINGLRLDDDYKKTLQDSIDNAKTLAINTLKPLIDKAQKLEGNMIAAEIKAKTMLVILETQRKVISSGQMQLNVIKDIEKEGSKNEEEIKKLVQEVEEINGIARNTLLAYTQSSNDIDNILNASQKNAFKSGNSGLEDIIADFKVV